MKPDRYTSKAYRAYAEAARPSLGQLLANMLYTTSRRVGFVARLNAAADAPKTPVNDIEPLAQPEPYNRKHDYVARLARVKQTPEYEARQQELSTRDRLRAQLTGTGRISDEHIFPTGIPGLNMYFRRGDFLVFGAQPRIALQPLIIFDEAHVEDASPSKGYTPPRGFKQAKHQARMHQADVIHRFGLFKQSLGRLRRSDND